MVKNTKKGKGRLVESLLKLGIGLVLIVLANAVVSRYFVRIDLTEEKRFTITESSKSMLGNLEDNVFVEVYLDGELPAGMKRLRNSIKERLDEFGIYANGQLQYEFIDPSLAISDKARNEFYNALYQRGLQGRRLFDNENGKNTEKIIFPGAIISYRDREIPVQLLSGQGGQEAINQSIESIEYQLSGAINSVMVTEKKKIGLIKGHAESDSLMLAGLTSVLNQNYLVFNVNLPEKEVLEGYDAVIISKPKRPFSEADKYKLDQYLMKGGKALFFLDQLYVNEDSALSQGTIALPVDLNLDDQLFKYGVRLNRDLVQDLSSGVMPVIVNMIGDEPEIQNFKWHFYPIINQFGDHPIVKNTGAIYTKFVNTIDTVKATGIKKTPLLFTSEYSKILNTPVRVALSDIVKLNQNDFPPGTPQPVGYLLEGRFSSIYSNRLLPKGFSKETFLEESADTKIIVVADGDLVENEFSMKNRQPVELGYSEFMQQKFANEDFIKNSLQYMLDEGGLILAKNKEIQIRPLNETRINKERPFWQVLNLALPILMVIVYGFIRFYWRKNKYTV